MKMTLDLNGSVLIVDESQQAAMLSLLETSKLYTCTGYSDYSYNPCDTLPEVKFIKDSQINGYEATVKQLQASVQEKQSSLWKVQHDKSAVEKQLKELTEKFEALEGIVRGVANAE